MTTKEFSQAFDTLIAAYNESTSFGEADKKLAFDEYEKSIFLTKAQDELIVSFYSGKNSYGEGFENTEEIRRYLASLIRTAEIEEESDEAEDEIEEEVATQEDGGVAEPDGTEEEPEEETPEEPTEETPEPIIKLTNISHIYKLKTDTWFITYEALKLTSTDTCLNGKTVEVVPITQDDLHKLLKNPFKGPNNRRALRLDVSNNSVEIIHPLGGKYLVRYLKEPSPIIVDTLDESLDIKGKHEITECELHEALHRTILDRAVQLAIVSRATASQQK